MKKIIVVFLLFLMACRQENKSLPEDISETAEEIIGPKDFISHPSEYFLQKKEGKNQDLFLQLEEALKKPRIMVTIEEWGRPIELENGEQTPTVQAGGLGTVAGDFADIFPHFLETYPTPSIGQVHFAFKALKNKIYGSKIDEIDIRLEPNTQIVEKVHVYHAISKKKAHFYWFQNEKIGKFGTKIDSSHMSPYFYDGTEEERISADLIFLKAVSKFIGKEKIPFAIFNDAHSAYGQFFLPLATSNITLVHNATEEYNILNGREYDPKIITHFLRWLHLSKKDFLDHYIIPSKTNIKKGRYAIAGFGPLWLGQEFNLITGIPVSPGYAQELQTINPPSGINSKNYSYNGGYKFPYLYGIYNGISIQDNAKDTKYLKKYDSSESSAEKSKIKQIILDRWDIDLNFGLNTDTNEQIKWKKNILKDYLQEQFDLKKNPNAPIFYFLGRIVGQKRVYLFAKVSEYILKQGGQVLIIGPGTSEEVKKVVKPLEIKYQGNITYKENYWIQGREKAILMGGADFILLTPKFEPCGLTDIEAAQMGNIVLARKTGGIGKVQSGIYYHWEEMENEEGEILQIKDLIQNGLKLYNNKIEFYNRIKMALNEHFPWEPSFKQYLKILYCNLIRRTLLFYHYNENLLLHEFGSPQAFIEKLTDLFRLSDTELLHKEEILQFYKEQFLLNKDVLQKNILEKKFVEHIGIIENKLSQ